MITHRLGLAETGHFCLSLRGAAGDVAISLVLTPDYCLLYPDYCLLVCKRDYRAAAVASGRFLNKPEYQVTI